MSYKYRDAVLEESRELAELDKLCFAIPWSKESFETDLADSKRAIYLVATDQDERIVGYAGILLAFDEGEITNIAVHPDHRGRGIAYELVRRLLERAEKAGAKSQTLEVRASNEVAIDLYELLGFKIEGIRRGYYFDNGEDALIMWRRTSS